MSRDFTRTAGPRFVVLGLLAGAMAVLGCGRQRVPEQGRARGPEQPAPIVRSTVPDVPFLDLGRVPTEIIHEGMLEKLAARIGADGFVATPREATVVGPAGSGGNHALQTNDAGYALGMAAALTVLGAGGRGTQSYQVTRYDVRAFALGDSTLPAAPPIGDEGQAVLDAWKNATTLGGQLQALHELQAKERLSEGIYDRLRRYLVLRAHRPTRPCDCLEWSVVAFFVIAGDEMVCANGAACARHFGFPDDACGDPDRSGRPWCFVASTCETATLETGQPSAGGSRRRQVCPEGVVPTSGPGS